MIKQILPVAAVIASMLFAGSSTAAEPKQGGSITVPALTSNFVNNFNPFNPSTPNKTEGLLFEPLVIYNQLTGETHFRLAESMEYSKDLKSITYTLRENLKWSDGSPLTAKDVVFSVNMARDHQALDRPGLWSKEILAGVEQINERQVRFNLTDVDTTAEWSIPGYIVVPEHIWSKVEDPVTFANTDLVGSGPMTTVKSLKPQQAEFCRNPHYFLKGRPYLDCVVMRAYNDNAQIQPALMKGELDWGLNFIADVDKTFVARDPEHNKYWYPPKGAVNLYVNTKRKPFSDVRVRQALSMALDREAIVDLATYGYATVNSNPGGIGNAQKKHISQDVLEKYGYLTEYNPERAKKLLDEAGYRDIDGDGFRETPEGEQISFNVEIVAGWSDWVQSVQMSTEYFRDIGLKANVKQTDVTMYLKNLREGTYDISLSWCTLGVDPIITFDNYYHTGRIGTSTQAGHGVNSSELDQKIDSYGKTTDKAERKQIIDDLQAFTAENLPLLALFSNPTWYQYRTDKFAGWPSAENPYVMPDWLHGEKRVLILNELHLKP